MRARAGARPRVNEERHELLIARGRAIVEHGASVGVGNLQVGSMLDENLNELERARALVARYVHGAHPGSIYSVDVGALRESPRHQRGLLVVHRHHQERVSKAVSRVDVDALRCDTFQRLYNLRRRLLVAFRVERN